MTVLLEYVTALLEVHNSLGIVPSFFCQNPNTIHLNTILKNNCIPIVLESLEVHFEVITLYAA